FADAATLRTNGANIDPDFAVITDYGSYSGGEVGNKKVYDPRSYLKAAEMGVVERMGEACDDLYSTGKTIFGKV
ncbi:MAG: hypothetical protein ACF8CY_00745, partial [Gimesia chilikensis]